jgi:hypothetical protein
MSVKVDYNILSMFEEVDTPRRGVVTTQSTAVFACKSKACAPPPVGTGGSKSTGGSRARTAERGEIAAKGGKKALINSLRKNAAAKGGSEPKGRLRGSKEAVGRMREKLSKYGTKLDPRGKGQKYPKATLPKQPPPKKFATAEEAMKAIRKNPKLNVEVPESELRTLVTELKKLAVERIEAGKAKGLSKAEADKAGEINLCQVSVPGTNMFCGESYDIPRLKMPQFGSSAAPSAKVIDMFNKGAKGVTKKTDEKGNDEYNVQPLYEQHLKNRGIKITEKMMPASQLSASQVEMKSSKVGGMADSDTFNPADTPILVSKDGYIVDGHHRWGAQLVRDYMDGKGGDLNLKVKVIDMDILDILEDANNFADTLGLERKAA